MAQRRGILAAIVGVRCGAASVPSLIARFPASRLFCPDIAHICKVVCRRCGCIGGRADGDRTTAGARVANKAGMPWQTMRSTVWRHCALEAASMSGQAKAISGLAGVRRDVARGRHRTAFSTCCSVSAKLAVAQCRREHQDRATTHGSAPRCRARRGVLIVSVETVKEYRQLAAKYRAFGFNWCLWVETNTC